MFPKYQCFHPLSVAGSPVLWSFVLIRAQLLCLPRFRKAHHCKTTTRPWLLAIFANSTILISLDLHLALVHLANLYLHLLHLSIADLIFFYSILILAAPIWMSQIPAWINKVSNSLLQNLRLYRFMSVLLKILPLAICSLVEWEPTRETAFSFPIPK